MAEHAPEGDAEVPRQFPNVPPPDIAPGAGHLRLIVQELKQDIKEIKDHRHSDFKWTITVFAAGFVALATMFIVGYLRLEDKIDPLTVSTVRMETKMDDLLARIPPAVTPIPKR